MQMMGDTFDEKRKTSNKEQKSTTRFPKQMPSYIVAFAVRETYDDIATAQQMICKKQSLQGSSSSVSPTLSSKTITGDQNSAQKIVDLDLSETENETKITIPEGDAENSINYDVPILPLDIKEYSVVDKNGEDYVNQADSSESIVNSDEKIHKTKSSNKVITNKSENPNDFESIKNPNACVNKLWNKKRRNQYRIRNVNFKYKKLLKNAEKDCKKSAKLKDAIYSNSVSKVISRKSHLKSHLTKLNVIEDTDSILVLDDENLNNGSPSSTKNSFISYSSQDTLRQKQSSSSRSEGMGSINTVSSVIKMPSENKLPYKTEVINVSVAVAYNPNKSNDIVTKTSEPYRSMYNGDLMSAETLVQSSHVLTSESTTSNTSENVQNIYLHKMNTKNNSQRTLKPKATSDNTYVVSNSSDLDDSSMRSEDTLAPNSETFMFAENLRSNFPIFDFDKDKSVNRPALLDTVINMGIFPEINPSTSSAVNFANNLNNVYITSDATKFIKNPTFKGDELLENDKETSKYVLKKSYETEKEINALKNVNLPNESAIKSVINDGNKIDSKYCSGEIGNYPSSITELWDRLVIVVDTAVKRLEISLTEKIITEMKKSFTVFEHTNRIAKEEILVNDFDKQKGDAIVSNKEVFVDKGDIKTEADEILQCNLVGNQVIDNIMLKLSMAGPETIIPETSSKSMQKIKMPKIFKDYFEVLKPPAVESSVVKERGDTVTVSTALVSELEESQSFNRVKSLLSGPVMFLRENMLVITSVPAFFVGLLFVYGLIVLVMNPF